MEHFSAPLRKRGEIMKHENKTNINWDIRIFRKVVSNY